MNREEVIKELANYYTLNCNYKDILASFYDEQVRALSVMDEAELAELMLEVGLDELM